jgi:hypothetical protein
VIAAGIDHPPALLLPFYHCGVILQTPVAPASGPAVKTFFAFCRKTQHSRPPTQQGAMAVEV